MKALMTQPWSHEVICDEFLIGSENLENSEGQCDDEPDLYRVGKKAAGAMLDGAAWKQFPEVSHG